MSHQGFQEAADTSVHDEWEVRTRLGDGMTACVYVAVHRQTGELRACKLCDRRKAKGCVALRMH